MNNNFINLPLTSKEEEEFIKNDKKVLIVTKEYSEPEVLSKMQFLYVSNKQRELLEKNIKTTLQDKYWETKNIDTYKVSNGSEAISLFEKITKENPKVDSRFVNEISACRELLPKDLINKLDVKKMINGINQFYPNKNLEILTNNSMFFITNTFPNNDKGKNKDELTLLNNFNEFIDKKLPQIVEKQVENRSIEKDYLQKLNNYEKDNKNTDLSKLYNSYKNLPNAVLKQSFREVLKDDLQKEILGKKDILLQKITDKSKGKQQEIGIDR